MGENLFRPREDGSRVEGDEGGLKGSDFGRNRRQTGGLMS